MWPVPSQASLVISTSPGCMPLGADLAQEVPHRRRQRADEGRDAAAVLGQRVAARVGEHAGEVVGLVGQVENEVRTMALAASSTTEMRRVHSTSSVIASSLALTAASPRCCRSRPPARSPPGPITRVEPSSSTTAGPRISSPAARRVAVVHRRLQKPSALGEVDRPRALERAPPRAAGPRAALAARRRLARDGRAHGHADVDELHRHVRRRERELLAVRRLEGRREPPRARRSRSS